MSKSDSWENDLLRLLLNNVAAALIGDASGLQPSATAGSLYVSLHSSDPGEAGAQNTNELAYGSYTRVAVARTTGGFTISANVASFAANVTFPPGTSGSVVNATHFGIGTAASGAGKLLYSGLITSPSGGIPTGNGVTPQIPAGTVITED